MSIFMNSINKASIIIVTWNHAAFLPACLEAITSQTYPDLEVIVVDNASEDGSAAWVCSHYPQIRVFEQTQNLGFAAGFNLGAKAASGEWLLSINPDLVPARDFVSRMVQAANSDARIGMVAPKLLRADDSNRLDSTGLFLDRRRRPYDRGQMQVDHGQYDTDVDVFGPCGAAALYRRAMLDDLTPDGEFFDEDFFAYCEDADLAWRARSRGWQSRYVPEAVASHVRGWGDTLRKAPRVNRSGPRLALRNRYLMSIKNDALPYWLIDFPLILLAELPRLVYMAVTRPSALLGLLDLLYLAPGAFRKRRSIRASRQVSDAALRQWFLQRRHA
jgi:GT2 family glycosyltransferase